MTCIGNSGDLPEVCKIDSNRLISGLLFRAQSFQKKTWLSPYLIGSFFCGFEQEVTKTIQSNPDLIVSAVLSGSS